MQKTKSKSKIPFRELCDELSGLKAMEEDEPSENLDSAIEKNYKAALTAKGLDTEHIRFDAKNGVLTLKGRVKTPLKRNEAEQLAQATPNVRQVLNQIDVNR